MNIMARLTGYLSLILAACFPLTGTAGPESESSEAVLWQEIETIRSETALPGVGVVLASKEGSRARAFGLADPASDRAFDPDRTVVRIGSITKTLNAIAALRLQAAGQLTLDDAVVSHVPNPSYANPWRATRPVTLAQLLEHTAGLPGLSADEFGHNESDPISLAAGFAVSPSSRQIGWPPGRYYSYSNSGAAVFAYALEAISGKPYETVMRDTVFDPLSMPRATFFHASDIQDDLVVGHTSDGEAVPYWHMIFRAFGAVNATLPEMGHVLEMLLSDGRFRDRQILSPTALARLETPATSLAARSGLAFGYGPGMAQWHHNGILIHGHEGEAHGALSLLAYSRAVGRGFFLTINQADEDAFGRLRTILEDWLVGDSEPVPAPPIYQLSESRIATIVGEYQPVAQRFPDRGEGGNMRLFRRDGALYTQTGDSEPRPLYPVNPQHFRRPDDPLATVAIVGTDTGELLFLDGGSNYRRQP